MPSAIRATISFSAVTGGDAPVGEPWAAQLQSPPRCLTGILANIFRCKGGGLGAAARPLLLLLLLSHKPAGDFQHVREQHEGTDASLLPFGNTSDFGLLYATADDTAGSPSIVQASLAGTAPLQENEPVVAHSASFQVSSVISGRKAALHDAISARRLSSGAASLAASSPLLVENNHLVYSSAYTSEQYVTRSTLERRRLAESEDAAGAGPGLMRVTGKNGEDKSVAAGGNRNDLRKEDAAAESRRRERTPEGQPTKAEALARGGGRGGGKGESKAGGEAEKVDPWSMLPAASKAHSRPGCKMHSSSRRNGRFSMLPPPLPESRVIPALRSFENVHGQLTLFFNGFSRKGSVIAYDLLNELRTVSEAQMMMDVEFLVLDRVMEHYGTPTHMRVVDTTVVHKLLDLKNFLPWRIPQLVSNIRKLALEYQPVLRQFLHRYEPVIEALVLVKVPAVVKTLRPFLAHVFGISQHKLVLASDLNDLREHIPLKYIPEEFGNLRGDKVRDGAENYMSWVIMLEEIAEKLGEDALSSSGKEMLKKYRGSCKMDKTLTDGHKEAHKSRTSLIPRDGLSRQAPPPPAATTREGLGGAYSGGEILEEDGSEEDSEGVGVYKKSSRVGMSRQTQPDNDEEEEDDESNRFESIYGDDVFDSTG